MIRGGEPFVKPRIGATLRKLGITFRSGKDDWMKGAHGIEATGKLPSYIAFLLHKTSYLGDGDAQYGASELVSNLPEERLEAICGLAMSGSAGELDAETVDRLRGEARDLGREFENFDKWAMKCGVDADQLAAARDRFYICEVMGEGRDRHLGLVSESHRGSEQVERERLGMFLAFQEKFNQALSSYVPGASIDYESYKDPAFRRADTQQVINSPIFWEQVGKFSALFWKDSGVWDGSYDRKMEYLRQFTDDEIKCIADKTGFRQVALVFAKGTLLRGVLEEYVREYDPDDFDFEPGPPPEEEGSE